MASRSNPACGFLFSLAAELVHAEHQKLVAYALWGRGTGINCRRRDAKGKPLTYFRTADPNVQSNSRKSVSMPNIARLPYFKRTVAEAYL
ncbi:hypothetical protein TNCV_655241 [Trichonephila clavipes]|nr:hypothetical protein TNCV_655241 [Trichonephila clavipes]